MNIQQSILCFILATLVTLCIYQLARALFVYRTASKKLYFAISTFGGSIFVFFALLLLGQTTPEHALFYHRARIFGLMICCVGWLLCMYEIYFTKSVVPRIFFLCTLVIALILPFDVFLSLPVQRISVQAMGSVFNYSFATPNPGYSLYAIVVLLFFAFSIYKVAFSENLPVSKVYGFLAFLPGLIAGLNDFSITHGLFKSMMLSEYLVFGFLVSAFAYFLAEEQHNHAMLQKLYEQLEVQVANRTHELQEANRMLKVAATTDMLTGLANLSELRKRIRMEEERINRKESDGVTIAFLDLDNFKYYNDTFGHHVGDFMLKKFSALLKDNSRYVDFIARYGGDEFILILPGANTEKSVQSVERLYQVLEDTNHLIPDLEEYLGHPVEIPDEFKLDFSTGIAEHRNGIPLEELIVRADKALYSSKKSGEKGGIGRDRIIIF